MKEVDKEPDLKGTAKSTFFVKPSALWAHQFHMCK